MERVKEEVGLLTEFHREKSKGIEVQWTFLRDPWFHRRLSPDGTQKKRWISHQSKNLEWRSVPLESEFWILTLEDEASINFTGLSLELIAKHQVAGSSILANGYQTTSRRGVGLWMENRSWRVESDLAEGSKEKRSKEWLEDWARIWVPSGDL